MQKQFPFFAENIWGAFAMQAPLIFFQLKILAQYLHTWCYEYYILIFDRGPH